MSSGGAFQIIANDGKTDKMIFSTEMLKKRICEITDVRRARGYQETLPTIRDIEQTHFIPFQDRFQPVVACASEYQVIQNSSGSVSFSSTATFDITPFGEFINDMILNLNLSTTSYAAAAVNAATANLGPADNSTSATSVDITLPTGEVLPSVENSTVNGVACTTIRRLRFRRRVTEGGFEIPDGSTIADRVMYCEFPGERIIRMNTCNFCSNKLDDYTFNDYVTFRQFELEPNKYVAYCKLMGQEVHKRTVSTPFEVSGTHPLSRKITNVVCGPQTPQVVQPALSLFIPFLFDFNRSVKRPMFSVGLPAGQRIFTIDLAAVDDIVFRAPAYYDECVLFEDRFTTQLTPTGGTYTLVGNTHRVGGGQATRATVLLYPQYTNGALSAPTFNNTNLYVNNIFTLTEIQDIYSARISFNLFRVHVRHQTGVNTSSQAIQLTGFKYPIESFSVGIYRSEYRNAPSTPAAERRHDMWDKFSTVTTNTVLQGSQRAVLCSALVGTPWTVATTNVTASLATDTVELLVATGTSETVQTLSSNVSTMEVRVFSVSLYRALTSRFYNEYLPYAYGGSKLQCPTDPGLLFVNFTRNPNEMQVAGHLNASRAREFFIDYVSPTVGSVSSSGATITGTFLANGRAVNFILQNEGSVNIRYIT